MCLFHVKLLSSCSPLRTTPEKIYQNIHAQATLLFIPSLFAEPIPTKTPVFNSQVTVWPMPSCKSLTSTIGEWGSDVSVKNGNMAQNLNCCHLFRNSLIFSPICFVPSFLEDFMLRLRYVFKKCRKHWSNLNKTPLFLLYLFASHSNFPWNGCQLGSPSCIFTGQIHSTGDLLCAPKRPLLN